MWSFLIVLVLRMAFRILIIQMPHIQLISFSTDTAGSITSWYIIARIGWPGWPESPPGGGDSLSTINTWKGSFSGSDFGGTATCVDTFCEIFQDDFGSNHNNYGVWITLTNVVEISIDIKPSSDTNSINLGSSGIVLVAILSSGIFDATTVKPESVALAGASVKMVGKSDKYLCHQEDVNLDGLIDLACQVYTAQFMVETGETTAILEAETFDGIRLRGEDIIRIVPDY